MDNQIVRSSWYKREEFSDVEFVVQNRNGINEKFAAHRFILASRSPVFERMFFGYLKEGRTVQIIDFCAESFAEFLQFFYLSKVDLTTENIAEVLKLIDKYDARDFYPACEAFMVQTLTKSTAHDYYGLSLSFDLADIKTKAEKILCKNRKLLFDTSGDVEFHKLVISNILQSDNLVGNEVVIFNDVMAWAKEMLIHQDQEPSVGNIQVVLGDLLQHIRFPTMTNEELLKCFDEYPCLLPSPQTIDILLFVTSGRELTVAKQFCCKTRLSVGKEYVIPFSVISWPKPLWVQHAHVTLTWKNNRVVKYSVVLKMDTGVYDGYFRVVLRGGSKEIYSGDLPVRPSRKNTYVLLHLEDPIVFSKSSSIQMQLQPSEQYNFKARYFFQPEGHLPDGLSITTYDPHFVSEIRLKEIN